MNSSPDATTDAFLRKGPRETVDQNWMHLLEICPELTPSGGVHIYLKPVEGMDKLLHCRGETSLQIQENLTTKQGWVLCPGPQRSRQLRAEQSQCSVLLCGGA
jgi:hypothetical protein